MADYSGELTKRIIEVGQTYYDMPYLGIPLNSSCLVHVWGKNTTNEAQQLGIYWKVTDPDGDIVEEYKAWEAWPYAGAGVEHEFIGGRWTASKLGSGGLKGRYKIHIELYMNKISPVKVYSWDGTVGWTIPEEEEPPEEPEKVQTLEVDITPQEGGHVETYPASKEGKTTWKNNETGTFAHGTDVRVTAIPAKGFKFKKWSDEIVGGVSMSNPAYVKTMTEHRAVKAHFEEEELEELYPLEVDITPESGGYVTTDPAPVDIENRWTHDTIGKFPKGIRVLVTAHPNSGFQFFKWTDQIEGGISYNNPEYVDGVIEPQAGSFPPVHKAVKAHFRETEEPPPGNGEEPPPGDGVPPPEEEEGKGINWWLWGGLAVIAVSLLLIFLQARKGR